MSRVTINIEDLFELENAVIYNPDIFKPCKHVVIDSRYIKPDSLFVAIKGASLDGHDFVFEAVKNGCSAIVINQNQLDKYDKINTTIVTVKDTTKAYGYLAAVWRKKLNATIISLTGSNGKTTTKELIYSLLSAKYKTNKSIANNNNHIGVPLTLFDSNEKHETVVIEHGTNHFNEIEYTAAIAKPDIALITNIGDSHLEYLLNREGVHKEKSALLIHTSSNGGQILLNTDDAFLKKDVKKYKNIFTYGFNGKPDIKGKIEGYTEIGQPKILITYKNKSINITLPLLGKANAINFLAAVSVALLMGMTKKEIISAVNNIQLVKGRLEYVDNNVNMLISDVYNSNPDSMKAAVDLLSKIKKYKNKILIVGDMYELGKDSVKYHEELVEVVKPNKNLRVLTIGKYMRYFHKKIINKNISGKHFNRRDQLTKFLETMELGNAVILVKGSRGMKMEEFAEVIRRRG